MEIGHLQIKISELKQVVKCLNNAWIHYGLKISDLISYLKSYIFYYFGSEQSMIKILSTFFQVDQIEFLSSPKSL